MRQGRKRPLLWQDIEMQALNGEVHKAGTGEAVASLMRQKGKEEGTKNSIGILRKNMLCKTLYRTLIDARDLNAWNTLTARNTLTGRITLTARERRLNRIPAQAAVPGKREAGSFLLQAGFVS